MLVDTHVHIVSDDHQRYPIEPTTQATSVSSAWYRELPVTAEELLQLMDNAGVDRATLVQAMSAYRFGNDYAADGARQYSQRFTSVCIIDMLAADAADRLSHWVEERGIRGIRIFTHVVPELQIDDPRTLPVWERAASLGVPVCVNVRLHQARGLSQVLERFPNVPVALDHLGNPEVEDGPPYESAQPLFELAKHPNLHLKYSTVNLYALQKGRADPQDFLQLLVDRFGARRLMWGSNFSATHDRSYRELVEMGRQSVSFLSDEEQRLILGENALRLWPELASDNKS